MTKKTRTILFILCVILFLLAAPVVILYLQGYRIDFNPASNGKMLTQTGGFYFKVWPQKSAEIYLDDKLKQKTDFFFGTTLIKNLLPKSYKITIKKEGYLPWEKTLQITEKMVTEAKNITLIPENLNFSVLVKNIDDYFFSPDGKEIILKKNDKNGWYLTLFNLEKNVESVLVENKKLSLLKNADFLDLNWSPDLKRIILEASIGEEEKYFLLELENPLPLSPVSLDFLAGAEKFSFNSQNAQEIFFLKNGSFFKANYKTKEISKPILSDLITYEISNGDIFYLDSSGFLQKSDFLGKNQIKINSEMFPFQEETKYQIFLDLPDIFLKEENVLFLFNSNSGIFEKIFEPLNEIVFSGDWKKMVFFNDNEIWIRYLENILDQPQKRVGDLQLTVRLSEKINKVSWLTNHYLIFGVEGKIKVAEIDDRDKIQIWDLGKIESSKFFFNQKDKKLYLLNNGDLYGSEELLK